MEGVVARIIADKGFGFIRDSSGTEYFFHRNSVKGAVFEALTQGEAVTFDEEDSTKGPRAGNVRRK